MRPWRRRGGWGGGVIVRWRVGGKFGGGGEAGDHGGWVGLEGRGEMAVEVGGV